MDIFSTFPLPSSVLLLIYSLKAIFYKFDIENPFDLFGPGLYSNEASINDNGKSRFKKNSFEVWLYCKFPFPCQTYKKRPLKITSVVGEI